jgi:hypothetical protein
MNNNANADRQNQADPGGDIGVGWMRKVLDRTSYSASISTNAPSTPASVLVA